MTEKVIDKVEEKVSEIDCRLGKIQFTESAVTTFKEGLFGFEHLRKFLFIEDDRENSIFNYLQSIDDPEIMFVLIQPSLIIKDYQLMVKKEDIRELYIENQTVDFAIATIPADEKKSTINLLGPIFINFEKGLGVQVISENKEYNTKHFISKEITKKLNAKKVS